ncbi:MAG: tRNA uridine(34) 5-carboxymethylaminomethyl modification radical SAM/GNAT enzyme Elp3 [Patescibacteria group bacterium]
MDKKNTEKIIQDLIKNNPKTSKDFLAWKRKISKKYNISLLKNSEIIDVGTRHGVFKKNSKLLTLLKKRAVRTSSGVSIITVLTKPYKCPGNCIYCPSEPKMPKSYLSNEPAAQRAFKLKFNAIKQVQMRIKALEANGHQVDKIELLVLGGSFTAYTDKYKNDFIRDCFFAANSFSSLSFPRKRESRRALSQEQKINEKAKYKIIGLTLETRPDEINEKVIKNFRKLGCTRVQLGIQHIDNKILKLNRRGHGVEESIMATRLLKENGFKVDHHYMPDLPGSTPAKDLAMMKQVFTDLDFKPDQIKLYPCVVNKYAEIYKLYKNKKYKPYSEKQLFNLLKNIKKITPYWVRINRLVRDIPADSIIAGNRITNLRQYLKKEVKCKCIRCREVGTRHGAFFPKAGKLFIIKYKASGGTEYFISYESANRKILYGFLRLRFNNRNTQPVFQVLKNSAIIRELHVYGQMLPVGDNIKAVQHSGLGKKLMQEAEKISKKRPYRAKKIAVISGIGVRGYYKKLGYKLKDTYLVKKLI